MAVLGELGGAESGGLEVSSSARVLERSSLLGHWKDCGICGTSWDREDRDRALRGAGIGERVRKAPASHSNLSGL